MAEGHDHNEQLVILDRVVDDPVVTDTYPQPRAAAESLHSDGRGSTASSVISPTTGSSPANSTCARAICVGVHRYSDGMRTWRYVVSLDADEQSGEQSWEIRELYPADNGEPTYTKDPVHPFGNSFAELLRDIEHMRQDCELDVLDLRGGVSRLVALDHVMAELPADDERALTATSWEVPHELRKATEDVAKVICICGSTRFCDAMADANRKLTLAGLIVVAPAVFQHHGDAITTDQKRALDELHLKKIDLADAVFVVDPGGYIGESTSREIAYAESTDKPVVRLSSLLGM